MGLSARDRDERRPGRFVERGVVQSVQPEKKTLCAQATRVPALHGKSETQIRAFYFEKENDMLLMSSEAEEVGTFKIDRVTIAESTTLCGLFDLTETHIVSPGDLVGVELAPSTYKPQTQNGPPPILPPDRIRHEVDKKIMLRISWDYLVYGQGEDPTADNYNPHFFDRSPLVTPKIETFYMDQYEVTNREYLFFCKRAGHTIPEAWRITGQYPEGTGDHPFTLASFEDAQHYARWTGKRLPTEFEWELSARGGLKLLRNGSGVEGIKRSPPVYPMGQWSPDVCNTREMWNGEPRTISVFSLKDRSPYGIVGMCGSAAEWTSSWYNAYPGQTEFPENLSGQQFRVLRGGSFSQPRDFARTDSRDYGGLESPRSDRRGGIRLVLSAK